MKVRFDLDKEDVWNFNKYAIFNVPKMRNKFWRNIILIPICVLASSYLMEVQKTYAIMATIVAPILGYLYSTSRMKTHIIKSIYNNRGVLCEHTIKINEEGIREITPVNDIFHPWKDIKDVKENKEYIFVFVDNTMAHIVPKRGFPSELQCKEFFNKSLVAVEKSK